jgi:hypothetical protein
MADAQIGTDRRDAAREPRPSTEARPGGPHGDGPRWGHWPATEPKTFGPPLIGVGGMSALPLRASLAIGEAGFDLFARQTQAVSHYWQAVSAAGAPWDVLSASHDYWTQFRRSLLAEADRARDDGGPDR